MVARCESLHHRNNFQDIDVNTMRNLLYAIRSVIKTLLDHHSYWDINGVTHIGDYISSAARTAHRRMRSDNANYELTIELSSGMEEIIELVNGHLDSNEHVFDLYLRADATYDRTILFYISESVYNLVAAFANTFEGYEDASWSTAQGVLTAVFGRFESQADGMNPLQQRIATKFINETRRNIDGFYPAITRVLLAIIGPYENCVEKNPRSAFHLFKRAFYLEIKRFPDLYRKDQKKAAYYLPPNVRYDPENHGLVHRYRLGEEVTTELDTLSIEPITFDKSVVAGIRVTNSFG